LLQKAQIVEEDRPCVKAAREKEARTHSFSGAIELEDGTLITGKTSQFMGPCAAIIMNAIKYLANIDEKEDLIKKDAFKPIQNLKTNYLGSLNPRLHSNEMLIALSLSAQSNPLAKKALEQLPKLQGNQAHITSRISNVDMTILNNLGIQVTYEAQKG